MLVRGVDLHVEERGDGDRARTFVFAHGLFGSVAGDDQSGLFRWAPPGWRVVRYDARGHGRSGWTDDPAAQTWDQLGLDMVEVASGVGADRFVGGGASMGCATTIHAALAAPERVDALVLVIPPTAWGTRESQAGLYRAGSELLERQGLDPYLDAVRRTPESPFSAREMPEAKPLRLDRMRHMGGLATVLRASSQSNLPPLETIATLRMPALVLAWDEDAVHPLETAERLVETLPEAELHVARTRAEVEAWTPVVEGFLGRL